MLQIIYTYYSYFDCRENNNEENEALPYRDVRSVSFTKILFYSFFLCTYSWSLIFFTSYFLENCLYQSWVLQHTAKKGHSSTDFCIAMVFGSQKCILESRVMQHVPGSLDSENISKFLCFLPKTLVFTILCG